MSQQGVETIESTTQKTHERITHVADTGRMDKRDAYRASRAVLLHTVRDRLPVVMHSFPHDIQSLLPVLASAA